MIIIIIITILIIIMITVVHGFFIISVLFVMTLRQLKIILPIGHTYFIVKIAIFIK